LIEGVGIDLVEIPGLAVKLRNRSFLRKVYTPAEIEDCQVYAEPDEHFAGKFVAKEAFMKALGRGIRQEVWFTQIEVMNEESGAPRITISGEARRVLENLEVKKIHVTITHTNRTAAAIVILEK